MKNKNYIDNMATAIIQVVELHRELVFRDVVQLQDIALNTLVNVFTDILIIIQIGHIILKIDKTNLILEPWLEVLLGE